MDLHECGGIVLSDTRRFASGASHRFAERPCFRLLLSGSYRERLRNQSCLRESLTVVFEPVGAEHHDDIEHARAQLFSIELGGPWQDRAYLLDAPLADLHGGDLLWLALHVYREFTRLPDPLARLAIEGLVMQMVADAARTRARSRQGMPPPWLQRVLSRLHAGPCEDGLKGLASVAHVHPVHLSRGFRRFTGFTFGEYVQRLRVQCACRHMLQPNLTLCEIANLSGFADQSHLTNVVRTITGFTPAVLRDLLPTAFEATDQLHPSLLVFHPVQDTLHPTSPMFALGSG